MVSSRRKYHIEDTFTLSGAKNLLIPGGVGIRSKPLRFENGGSLEIYQYKKSNKIFDRFPNKNNLKLIKKIPPKFGKLIVFLSSPESIHGVEKFVAKNNEKRIFLYGSYTSFSNVNWIKSS